ncbi:MAG: ribosomal-protein-alanine N-acetyltransferase [Clostridiales bacterium]|nr:ribosomal-protein-alanine N-acetyltransferase [Clostridiales bacterium]
MIIQRWCLSDVKQIAEMEQRYIYHPYSEAVLGEMLNNPSCLGLKIMDGDVLAAYVSGEFVIDEFNINNVVVDKDYRRRGYAEALIREVIDRCKQSGVQKIYLEVAQNNEAAKNLYYKLDFTFSYERKKYYGEQSALVLVKTV